LRYAVSYCVFGFPENKDLENTPCRTSEACGPFQDAIRHGNLTTDDLDKYDYCATWPVTDLEHVEACRTCLELDEQEYLANFVTTLQAGCEQQPADGVTVAIEGNVFSTETVTVADPSSQAKIDPAWFDDGPLNVGAKAGIAAAGVVVILSIAGCCIVWRGKRKRRAFLRNYEAKQGRSKGWPSPIQTQGMKEVSDTPLSQRPLRAWDDSPMSQQSVGEFPGRYFSPYSSQYNSPVSASDAVLMGQQWPAAAYPQPQQHQFQQQQQQQQNIGLALGGVDTGSDGKGKTATEEYEMQFVDNGYHDHNGMSPVGAGEQREDYFTHRQHERSYSGSYRNFSAGSMRGANGPRDGDQGMTG